jgi:heme-degrading monooxygenase HmoA
MIVVIFELEVAPESAARYFELAAQLRQRLEAIDGFIHVERFQSVSDPTRYLSLSTWRDEEAVRAWRCDERHRHAQAEGRGGLFAGYRLRVASVMRDYGLRERDGVPSDAPAAR